MKIKIEQLMPGTIFELNNSGKNISEFKLKSLGTLCGLEHYETERFITEFKKDIKYISILPKLGGVFQESYTMFIEYGTLVDVN